VGVCRWSTPLPPPSAPASNVRLAEVDPLTLADNELPGHRAAHRWPRVPAAERDAWPAAGWRKRCRSPSAGPSMRRPRCRPTRSRNLSTGRILRARPQTALDERGSSAGPRRANSWFLAAFRGSRRIYAEAILATIVINILALAMPLFTMNVYDRVLPNAAAETMWALAIGVVLATLFDFTIKMLRANFVDTASRRADIKLANFIYGRLLSAKLPERPVSAGVRANALRELETVRDFFNSLTLTAFGDVPFLVLYLAVIWVIAGPLMLVGLAAVPLVICAGLITQRALSRHMQASFQETAQKNAVVVETLVGLETIKSAGAESWAAGKWEQAVSDHIRTGLRIRKLSNLGVHVVQAAQVLTQVAMVLVGFYMVAAGQITAGALIASTMLIGRALGPLGAIATIISRLHQTRLAYRALGEVANSRKSAPWACASCPSRSSPARSTPTTSPSAMSARRRPPCAR
jgi:ATP-binding cassette subfamily C protein LapB